MSKISKRQREAERWRRLGEMLRRRSPELFVKMLAVAEASAVRSDDDDPDVSLSLIN